jgi:hypothetical protein
MEGLERIIVGIIFFVVAVPFYFFPAIIAWYRKHERVEVVFLVNGLVAWTVVGWIVTLLWAFSGPGAAESPSEKTFKSNWPET